MKKIVFPFFILSLVLLVGCSRTEFLANKVQKTVEERENSRNPDISVKKIVLILREGNHYFGKAQYTGYITFYNRKTQEEFKSEIKVYYDGKSYECEWEHPRFR